MLFATLEDGSLVSAYEIYESRKWYVSLFCPCCREQVNLRAGKIRDPYFAHSARDANTPDCDSRVNSIGISTYLKESLPLQLKPVGGHSNFELFIGFPKLGEDLLKVAEKNNFEVVISSSSAPEENFRLKINRRNFLADELTSFHIYRVPAYGSEWKIEWIGRVNIGLSIKWANYCTGIHPYSNPIFDTKRNYKRVLPGGDIYLDHKYLLIRGNRLTEQEIADLALIKEGDIRYNNLNHEVYSLQIPSSVAEDFEQFEELKKKVQDLFQLNLSDPRLKPLALWPPASLCGNTYKPLRRNKLFFSIGQKVDEENKLTCLANDSTFRCHELNSQTIIVIRKEFDPNKKADPNDYEHLITHVTLFKLDEETSFDISHVKQGELQSVAHCPITYLDVAKHVLPIPMSDDEWKSVKALEFSADYDFLLLDKNWNTVLIKKGAKDSKKNRIDLKEIMGVWILEGKSILREIYPPKIELSKIGLPDNVLYKNRKLVKTPDWIYSIYRRARKGENNNLCKELKKYIASGLIPLELLLTINSMRTKKE